MKIRAYNTPLNIIAGIGGFFKILQMAIGVVFMNFVYKRYCQYMVWSIQESKKEEEEPDFFSKIKKRRTHRDSITSSGKSIKPIGAEGAAKLFSQRMSAESIYNLYERIEKMERDLNDVKAENEDLKD